MSAKTEELLWMLLWTCEMLSRPTWRNLNESFEGWAYRNGFLRQVQRLERRKWLESRSTVEGTRLHRLSTLGRLHALGGRDPAERWNRPWDGRWRLVLFDVPEDRSSVRNRLRAHLRNRGFGYLQNSVWITPDPVTMERALIAEKPIDVESLIMLEARPCAGESDAEIVAGAWDFAEINRRYALHGRVLDQCPDQDADGKAGVTALRVWLRREMEAWRDAEAQDPLLPRLLLPPGYAGCAAWERRIAVMKGVGERMRAFCPG